MNHDEQRFDQNIILAIFNYVDTSEVWRKEKSMHILSSINKITMLLMHISLSWIIMQETLFEEMQLKWVQEKLQ